jgi:hypothetical protein
VPPPPKAEFYVVKKKQEKTLNEKIRELMIQQARKEKAGTALDAGAETKSKGEAATAMAKEKMGGRYDMREVRKGVYTFDGWEIDCNSAYSVEEVMLGLESINPLYDASFTSKVLKSPQFLQKDGKISGDALFRLLSKLNECYWLNEKREELMKAAGISFKKEFNEAIKGVANSMDGLVENIGGSGNYAVWIYPAEKEESLVQILKDIGTS